MSKTKITISIDKKFVADLDRIAKLKRSNRSTLIEEAIKVWERKYIEAALKQGYQAMAKEDCKTAEEYVRIAQSSTGTHC